jgi:hypothetical protein
MPKSAAARIEQFFVELTDPRRRKVTYPLINVVTIALAIVRTRVHLIEPFSQRFVVRVTDAGEGARMPCRTITPHRPGRDLTRRPE